MGTVLSQFDSFTLFENFCSVFRRKTFKMTEERVQSKNLFNFRPQGFIDPEVVFYDEKMKKDFGLDPQAMEEQMKSQTEEEFVGGDEGLHERISRTDTFFYSPCLY